MNSRWHGGYRGGFAVVSLLLAGCGGGDGPSDSGARSLDFERRAIAVVLPDTARFVAFGLDSSYNHVPVSGVRWSSTDTNIATVDQQGLVHSRRVGSVGIQATQGSMVANGYFEVRSPIATIEVLVPAGPHVRNAGFAAKYKLHGEDGSETWRDGGFEWSSSNTQVAGVVNNFGDIVVTPHNSGTAQVTLSLEGKSGSAAVEVISLKYQLMAPGEGHACGLNEDGRVFCWGGNGGANGTDGAAPDAPRIVVGNHRFDSLSVGEDHNCALEPDGTAWCWGGTTAGQLGDGAQQSGAHPVLVAGGHHFGSIQASVRINTTCALTLAGELYCWGSNEWGAYGTGTSVGTSVPSRGAPGLLFTRFSFSGRHACGIVANGDMYCWGGNESGQAGRNLTIAVSPDPGLVYGGHHFVDVAVGVQDTCGLTTDSETWCWGFHALATDPPARDSIPVKRTGGPPFVALFAGTNTYCGLTAAGAAWCWGDGFDWAPSALPSGEGLRTLAVGNGSICGTVADGTAYCWGIIGPHVRQAQPH